MSYRSEFKKKLLNLARQDCVNRLSEVLTFSLHSTTYVSDRIWYIAYRKKCDIIH